MNQNIDHVLITVGQIGQNPASLQFHVPNDILDLRFNLRLIQDGKDDVTQLSRLKQLI